jgi:hypothetical protein
MIDFFKITLIAFLPFIGSYTNAQNNILKIDLFGITNGVNRLAYEKAFQKHFSFSVNAEFGIYKNSPITMAADSFPRLYNIKGFGFMPELRYYFGKKQVAPFGFFIGLHARKRFIKERYFYTGSIDPYSSSFSNHPDIMTNGRITDYGIHAGYKYSWNKSIQNGINRINFEVLAGYGISSQSWASSNHRDQIPASAISNANKKIWDTLRFQISVGYFFGFHDNRPANMN